MRQLVKRQKFAVNNIKPKALLTKLVLRCAKQLPVRDRLLFILYSRAKRTEHLPDGIPYKVVSDPHVFLATFVKGLNQPLILVGAKIKNYNARQVAARHEYNEWKTALSVARHRKGSKVSYLSGEKAAHTRALKIESHRNILKGLLKTKFSLPE